MVSSKYLTPLDIQPGKSGNCEVVRTVEPPGKKMMLGNLRTAYIGGQGVHKDLYWPHETTWHQLLIDGSRMMSDWPIEQRQHNEELKGMRGRVLIGGLGLGYAATVLLKRASVTHVTVVEISADVIKLVAPFTRDPSNKLTVVHADLLEFYRDYNGQRFDWAFHDIWASNGEGTFHETVVPLYQLSQGKVRRMPVNWNENVMRGQLRMALDSRLRYLEPGALKHLTGSDSPKGWRDPWEHDGTDRPWHNWCVPFFMWWKKASPTNDEATKMARMYASVYGLWSWEDLWKAAVT